LRSSDDQFTQDIFLNSWRELMIHLTFHLSFRIDRRVGSGLYYYRQRKINCRITGKGVNDNQTGAKMALERSEKWFFIFWTICQIPSKDSAIEVSRKHFGRLSINVDRTRLTINTREIQKCPVAVWTAQAKSMHAIVKSSTLWKVSRISLSRLPERGIFVWVTAGLW
jgi:hypothetical protein